jgi:hypothetical protein
LSRQGDIGRRMTMGAPQILKMRGAGDGVFGAHSLCSRRTAARAGMTHRFGSDQICDGERGLASFLLCSQFPNFLSTKISEIHDCHSF